MKTSESIVTIAAALTKALCAMKNPDLDSNNPFFKSKYASLAGVRNTVMPTLAENGVAVIQNLSTEEHGVRCATRFLHTSGEWIETDGFTVPVGKGDAQGAAAASTYARRIDLMAACGVVGDIDDDGNEAAAHSKDKKAKPEASGKPQDAPEAQKPVASPWTAKIAACATRDALDALWKLVPSIELSAARRDEFKARAKAISDAFSDEAFGPSGPGEDIVAAVEHSKDNGRSAVEAVKVCEEARKELSVARWTQLVKAAGGNPDPLATSWHAALGLDSLRALANQCHNAVLETKKVRAK